MKEVFVTAAPAFVEASLKQLIEACELPGEAKGATISMSAGLEIIASLEPETEAQAALAIHIACLHAATINVLGRTSIVLDRNLIAMTTSAAKLERAFQLALETYHRLKHGSRQVVRVERVDIHAGGQAVVGSCNSALRDNHDVPNSVEHNHAFTHAYLFMAQPIHFFHFSGNAPSHRLSWTRHYISRFRQ